jgi:hypothetical protein
MPFDTSGNFTRVMNWEQDRDNGILIMADRHDSEDDNFASALNQAFLRTGSVPMGGDLAMGGNGIHAMGAGSATLPSLTWQQNHSTGFYAVDANTLGFASNGVEMFTFGQTFTFDCPVNLNSPTGNVTIGGTLTVSGSGTFTGGLQSMHDDPGIRVITASGCGWRMYTSSAGSTLSTLVFQSTTDAFATVINTALTLDPVTGVTVTNGLSVNGTTTLSQGLNVANAINASDANIELGINRTADGNAYIDLHSTAGAGASYDLRILRYPGANGGSVITHKGTGTLELQTEGSAPIALATNALTRMTVNIAGNVGIGPNFANDKLDVQGSVTIADGSWLYSGYNGTTWTGTIRAGICFDGKNQAVDIATAGTIRWTMDGAGTVTMTGQNLFMNTNKLQLSHDGSEGIFRTMSGGGPLYLGTNGSNSMFLGTNGNVGINNYNPQAKLHITGADSVIALGINGSAIGCRMTPTPAQFNIEAVDNTLLASYQPLEIGSSGTTFNVNAIGKMSIGPNITTITNATTYIQGVLIQQADSTQHQLVTAAGCGYRFINVSTGSTLGRSVWQATNNNFSAVVGIGFTYDATQNAVYPESDGGLLFGTPTNRFSNGNFSGVITSSQYMAAGSAAALNFQDRAGGSNPTWIIYATGANARLYNSSLARDLCYWSNVAFGPSNDNTMNIGDSTHRIATYWGVNGTIATSDEREKTWRGPLTDTELLAASDMVREIGIYQWNTAIEEKGPDDARWHVGVVAQTLEKILNKHGLDPFKYSFLCYDEWEESTDTNHSGDEIITPAGNRYSVRYQDLTMFMLAAQEQRLAKLEEIING